jgi:hypothetical protein
LSLFSQHGGSSCPLLLPSNSSPKALKKYPIPGQNKAFPIPFKPFSPLFFSVCWAISPPSPKSSDGQKTISGNSKSFFPSRQKKKDKKNQKEVPHAITLARILRKLSLQHLQTAFAEFLNTILHDTPLVAAVDGKTAKQMKDENGDPLLMLNVFAHTLKVHLASWSVHGDKTNEPGCLKNHLAELFTMFPCLKLLTGDAIYAQRPLLEAIQEYHRDYLVQVKENQPKVLEQMKLVFANATQQEPSNRKVSQKRAAARLAVCG